MKLISFYGNEIVITDDERKIERLKALGFKQKELEKQELPKKEGAKKNGAKRCKVRTEGNI